MAIVVKGNRIARIRSNILSIADQRGTKCFKYSCQLNCCKCGHIWDEEWWHFLWSKQTIGEKFFDTVIFLLKKCQIFNDLLLAVQKTSKDKILTLSITLIKTTDLKDPSSSSPKNDLFTNDSKVPHLFPCEFGTSLLAFVKLDWKIAFRLCNQNKLFLCWTARRYKHDLFILVAYELELLILPTDKSSISWFAGNSNMNP